MSKRRPALDSSQLGFTFDTPRRARGVGELAGFDRVVASAVSQILGCDGRNRREIAFALSTLLDEDISAMTLDGWASEARDTFNVPFHRALALIAVTERFDVLDALVRRIGGSVLVGSEIITARLGHIDRQIAELKQIRSEVAKQAQPIGRVRGDYEA